MEQWIIDNLQILLLAAFVVLPLLFNRKRLKKGRQKPTTGPTMARPEEAKKKGASLEEKVRRFFEEMVEESQPKRRAPPPASARTAAPEPPVGPIPAFPPSKPEPVPDLRPDEPEPITTLRSPGSDPSRQMVHAEPDADDFSVIGTDETASVDWVRHAEPHHGAVPPEAAPPAAGYGSIDRKAGKGAPAFGTGRGIFGTVGEVRTARRSEIPFWLVSEEGLSRDDIRKAVVWKEILDKPVGLR